MTYFFPMLTSSLFIVLRKWLLLPWLMDKFSALGTKSRNGDGAMFARDGTIHTGG
jgi:hypothetical protein